MRASIFDVDRLIPQSPVLMDIFHQARGIISYRVRGCLLSVADLRGACLAGHDILLGRLSAEEVSANSMGNKKKAWALGKSPDSRTSWELRQPNVDDGVRGGAVRGKSSIIACHGTGYEKLDEALALVVAVKAMDLTLHLAQRCARVSFNDHFLPLWQGVRKFR